MIIKYLELPINFLEKDFAMCLKTLLLLVMPHVFLLNIAI